MLPLLNLTKLCGGWKLEANTALRAWENICKKRDEAFLFSPAIMAVGRWAWTRCGKADIAAV